MGGFNPSGDSQIVQELPSAIGGVWGMQAYFNGAVYFAGQWDYLKAFVLTNGTLSTSAAYQSSSGFGYPGPGLSISSNGTHNGIVWALDEREWVSGGPGVLRAYDAGNLVELYNSAKNASRDRLGPAVKFAVPTRANGKAYVGTGNTLAIFALL